MTGPDRWYPLSKLLARSAWLIPCRELDEIEVGDDLAQERPGHLHLLDLPAGPWTWLGQHDSRPLTGPATLLVDGTWRLRGRGRIRHCSLQAEHPRYGDVLGLLDLPVILPQALPAADWRRALDHATAARAGSIWRRPRAVQAAADLVVALLAAAAEAGLLRMRQHDGPPVWFIRALHHIESRLADPDLRISAIAPRVGRSPSQLRQAFHRHLQRSPQEYLRGRRFTRARDLLLHEPRCTIGEVARNAGFRDPAYFSRAFADRFGCTPSRWRARELALDPVA